MPLTDLGHISKPELQQIYLRCLYAYIWPRLPPDHPYHLPPGYHYPDNLPEGHPGHFYPGMPPYPVIAP